jgi:rhodanese-related sulfurtransferase
MKQTINVSELQRLLSTDPGLQMIDVRSPEEYAIGHVPRAVNIPLDQVETRLPDLGARVAILCHSGTRASMACELLYAHHPDLLVVEGGTQAWIAAGNKITASARPTRWTLERQVRLIAGLLVLTGTVLSLTAAPGWIYLAMFVGAGLTFAGATNVCMMATLLAKLPWNRPTSVAAPAPKVNS